LGAKKAPYACPVDMRDDDHVELARPIRVALSLVRTGSMGPVGTSVLESSPNLTVQVDTRDRARHDVRPGSHRLSALSHPGGELGRYGARAHRRRVLGLDRDIEIQVQAGGRVGVDAHARLAGVVITCRGFVKLITGPEQPSW